MEEIKHEVRTRFAPSPTGYMHVGNLRTALYTFLTAKHYNGKFILRIEDTDQERLVKDATNTIFNSLKEIGLDWDEGPDIGGNFGPYIQSQRMAIYKQYAEYLVKTGHAYYCFCSKERLSKLHEDQIKSGLAVGNYDRCCRNLTNEEVNAKKASGEPYVIRQKMPLDGVSEFNDLIYGKISINNNELEDQILLKSDGMPTYNFANVIDDHLMQITHVIRGNEYLSSTPKYNLLYHAFGWEPPIYIHCPPVMKDKHSKLSKRNGDASYQDLKKEGFLSEAILNYLLLLGWSPLGTNEILSLDQMVKEWDPSRINKSPAIFDKEKLKYINAEYIRKMSDEEFELRAKQWIGEKINKIHDYSLLCRNLKIRCNVLSDIPNRISFIDKIPNYDINFYENKKQGTTIITSFDALKILSNLLTNENDWELNNIVKICMEKAKDLNVKTGWLLYPLGIALSGSQKTPGGGTDLAAILGKEETLRRINLAVEKLQKYVDNN